MHVLCELKRAIFELDMATEIIRILREEIVSDAFEVKNNSNDRLSKNSESKSNSPQNDAKIQMQERGSGQGETAKEQQVMLKDNRGPFSRRENDTELQRKFNEAAKMKERLDEQFTTLSSNKENVDVPSSARTIDKTIFKHIPVISDS
jgi:hypothetical protein